MSIKALITDPSTNKWAAVDSGEEVNALVVATRPLKSYAPRIKFFTNPVYGYNMNIDAGFSGMPEHIHNGIDNVYWTASAITGTWTFNSTTQAHTGTKSIDASATVHDDTAQIAKDFTTTLSGTAITGWAYLSFWEDKDIKKIEMYGWDTATSLQVGKSVDLKNYIDIGLIGSWQKFVVSLFDMSLTDETMDAIRFKTIDIGKGDPPDYYLDDIQIEEIGTLVEFSIKPSSNTWLYIKNIDFVFVDACSSILKDATMPHLSYDKLLGVSSLSNGILYQGTIGGETRLTFPLKNLSDFFVFPGSKIVGYGSDGTNTFLKIALELYEPVILQSEYDDKLSFIVSDDLSGLLKLVVTASCKEEYR